MTTPSSPAEITTPEMAATIISEFDEHPWNDPGWMNHRVFPDDPENAYNLMCILMQNSRPDQVGFAHPSFDNQKTSFNEKQTYLTSPPEVVEGIFTCHKCKSTRTISYAKQTRSGDEATTVFVTCVNCQRKWTEN